MANLFGRHVGRAALFLASVLAVLVLLGAVPALADDGESSVRMAVDPTVLPPVLPPEGAGEAPPATEQPAPAPAVAPADGVGEADLAPEGASAKPEPPAVIVAEPPAPDKEPAPPAKPAAEVPAAEPAPAAEAESEPVGSTPGTVKRVALTSTATGFTLTLTCDRPVGDTTYMNLTSPRRLVVDLRQPWKLGTRNVARSVTGMVRHVVAGEHPDRLRFVVHFRTPPGGALSPEFRRTGNTLTVTVNTD